jgi:hypothetical protein
MISTLLKKWFKSTIKLIGCKSELFDERQVACSRTNRFGGDDLIAFDDKHPSKEVV